MNTEAGQRVLTTLLRSELIPAMGCTEPVAIAYAAALVRHTLGCMPEWIELRCSASIIKNVKGVRVPNTGGMKGLEAAATAGVVAGDKDLLLEVLRPVSTEHLAQIRSLIDSGFCTTMVAPVPDNFLYIDISAFVEDSSARVVVEHTHTGVTRIEKDGICLVCVGSDSESDPDIVQAVASPENPDPAAGGLLTVRGILEFSEAVSLPEVQDLIQSQIEINSAIADEGMAGDYGVSVGKALLRAGTDLRTRARARAAAASDARMGGCALPVVINSGSGNQGLALSLPIVEYARSLGCTEERLIRALVLANLVSIRINREVGTLSAFCGSVCAAAGAAAGIAWLEGGGYDRIAAVITTTIATAGGILCDGAKSSCPAKIATALEAAFLALDLSERGAATFPADEGLVTGDVEATIRSIGKVGSEGMRGTNATIVKIMLGREVGC